MRQKSKTKPKSSFNSVIFVIFLLITGLFGSLLLIFRTPDFEDVFWKTMSANLRSRSLQFNSDVVLRIDDQSVDLQSLAGNFALSFPQTLSLRQSTLVADNITCLPDSSSNLKTNFLNLFEQRYVQELNLSETAVYFRHDCEYETIDDQTVNPRPTADRFALQEWHRAEFSDHKQAEFQIYFLSWLAYNGLFYGYFDSQQRAELLDDMKSFYQIDWQNDVQAYREAGRLYYSYKLNIRRSNLGEAFSNYYSFLSQNFPALSKAFNKDSLQRYFKAVFAEESNEYMLIIDVYAQQVSSLRGHITLPFQSAVPLIDPDFTVSPPHNSQLITALAQRTASIEFMRVEMEIIAQNYKTRPSKITDFKNLKDEESDS